MDNLPVRYSIKSRIAALLTGALLVATLFAALGAGPDEPESASANIPWEMFEGHAYAENRAAPAGISLMACLGGCEEGYATAPVITGEDGIYKVKVEPGQMRPDGRMVTFWLVDGQQRVGADQDVLFRGNGETRVLDLNFETLPPVTIQDNSDVPQASGVTTDLTVPSASDLGLVTTDSPQAYVNSFTVGGMPLLPGFVSVLGLLLAASGISVLLYRRRLMW